MAGTLLARVPYRKLAATQSSVEGLGRELYLLHLLAKGYSNMQVSGKYPLHYTETRRMGAEARQTNRDGRIPHEGITMQLIGQPTNGV